MSQSPTISVNISTDEVEPFLMQKLIVSLQFYGAIDKQVI